MKLDPKTGQQKICYRLKTSLGVFLAWQRDETRLDKQRWYCTVDSPVRPADAPYLPMQWREFVGVPMIVEEINPSIKIAIAKGKIT